MELKNGGKMVSIGSFYRISFFVEYGVKLLSLSINNWLTYGYTFFEMIAKTRHDLLSTLSGSLGSTLLKGPP